MKFTTKKLAALIIIGIIFSIIGWVEPVSTPTINNIYNNTTSFSGSSISLFLHNDTDTSVTLTSKLMNRSIAPTTPISSINIASLAPGNTLIGNWSSNELNVNLIPSGVHELHLDAFKTGGSGGHVVKIYFVCYTTNSTGGNISLHGTSEFSNEVLAGVTTEVDMDLVLSDINMNLTDKMYIQVYANETGLGANPSLTVEFDDMTDSRLIIPATQQDITPLLNAKVNKSGDTMTGALVVQNSSAPSMIAIIGSSVNNTGIYGNSTNGYGVHAFSVNSSAIFGQSTNQNAVRGVSTNHIGMYGQSTNDTGVYGVSTNWFGVLGESNVLSGVRGTSTSSNGVYGVSTSGYGVRGQSANTYGVYSTSFYDNGSMFAPNIKASAQTSALCFDSTNGNITYNSGLTTCSPSDEKLKQNISTIQDSMIPSVMLLLPIRYTLNGRPNYGFSAQQVNSLFPELVGKEELYTNISTNITTGITTKSNPYDGNITGVKYENMVAILTKVIQEQQTTINKICGHDPTLCQ